MTIALASAIARVLAMFSGSGAFAGCRERCVIRLNSCNVLVFRLIDDYLRLRDNGGTCSITCLHRGFGYASGCRGVASFGAGILNGTVTRIRGRAPLGIDCARGGVNQRVDRVIFYVQSADDADLRSVIGIFDPTRVGGCN